MNEVHWHGHGGLQRCWKFLQEHFCENIKIYGVCVGGKKAHIVVEELSFIGKKKKAMSMARRGYWVVSESDLVSSL